ncbi:MAG: phosphate ABC transporter permease subunit PstC [Clostridia bacterium]|nr:phosphate ABC transporter permease subunit PstC [Clostridia bacterium]MBQ8382886.1 phosphate ABC transporter permease subunit PstC [Clostridia bacterium]
MKNQFKEKIMHGIFLIAACVSIFAVATICIFLFTSGVPAMFKAGIFDNFLFSGEWHPLNDEFGILPMILGSIYITAGAILIGVPIGILCAAFLAKFCPDWLYKLLKPAINLLAGIPSIVYGFFGVTVIVPIIRNLFGGSGKSILTASILLGIMILPTIISTTESAMRAVPASYYEGALALGATHERAVFKTIMPAAKSGILAGIVLGIGRAIGETMAVVMVAGNKTTFATSIFDGIRTMTSNIVLEMGYAQDLHREVLIATGVALFVFILLINLSFNLLKERGNRKEKQRRKKKIVTENKE